MMTGRSLLRAIVPIVLILTPAAAPLDAAAVSLIEPTTGNSVSVEPGSTALHLVFFATWCPECVDELTRLGEIEARWESQGYRLVLVAISTRHTADRLAAFAAAKRPPGRLLFDAEGRAADAWKAKRLPTHVLLDADGREVARSGSLDADFERAIAGLVDDARGDGRRR
jgi:peroxiredoxin